MTDFGDLPSGYSSDRPGSNADDRQNKHESKHESKHENEYENEYENDPGFDWRRILFDRDSFFPVLMLAVAAILVSPVVDESSFGYLMVFPVSASLVFLSLHRARVQRRTMHTSMIVLIVVAGGTLITSIARHTKLTDDRLLVAITSMLFAILFLVAFPAVVRRAFQHERVNLNTLAAGLTAYLLIGIWFASLYRTVSALENYDFFVNVLKPRSEDYTYFSFVTLTTLGYGDLVPRGDAARTLAIFEAILGQVFLVTAVARIVSLIGSERRPLAPRRSMPTTRDFGAEPEAD